MSDEPFKCGCETGYRDVSTGTLLKFEAGPAGVGLLLEMDDGSDMAFGLDRDADWAKAHVGKHLRVTIIQAPKQGPRDIAVEVIEGRESDLARKVARLMWVLGIEIKRGEEGLYHGHLPKDHPMIEKFGGKRVIPLPEGVIDTMADRLEAMIRERKKE